MTADFGIQSTSVLLLIKLGQGIFCQVAVDPAGKQLLFDFDTAPDFDSEFATSKGSRKALIIKPLLFPKSFKNLRDILFCQRKFFQLPKDFPGTAILVSAVFGGRLVGFRSALDDLGFRSAEW